MKGATAGAQLMYIGVCFNPRAREGRDHRRASGDGDRIVVSIHAPVKGATHHRSPRTGVGPGFNPRAREGRDRLARHARRRSPRSFNPRAREGRDLAAARPATDEPMSFNPRAREGRDQRCTMRELQVSSFNPRAREGRDCWGTDESIDRQ